jgi:hypothetical protein
MGIAKPMRRLYFITDKYMGKKPTLTPRVPRNRAVGEDETTERICVAPTLAGCYLGVFDGVQFAIPAMHVYVCEVDYSIPAGEVPDKKITGERWLCQPTQFKHLGKMSEFMVWGGRPLQTVEQYRREIRKDLRWLCGWNEGWDEIPKV